MAVGSCPLTIVNGLYSSALRVVAHSGESQAVFWLMTLLSVSSLQEKLSLFLFPQQVRSDGLDTHNAIERTSTTELYIPR